MHRGEQPIRPTAAWNRKARDPIVVSVSFQPGEIPDRAGWISPLSVVRGASHTGVVLFDGRIPAARFTPVIDRCRSCGVMGKERVRDDRSAQSCFITEGPRAAWIVGSRKITSEV